MSRKPYSDTINPQVAVQDYLDDLLQKLPATSPLDKLREEEALAHQAETDKKNQALKAKKDAKLKALSQHSVEAGSFLTTRDEKRQGLSHVSDSSCESKTVSYTAGRDVSIAAQRLEEKRAQSRVEKRAFREPLSIKPSPILQAMPEVPVEVPPVTVNEKKTEEIVRPTVTVKKLAPTPQALSEKPTEQQVKKTTKEISETAQKQSLEAGQWLENGRPQWAQGRFECLIFKVAGLKLAVPLVALGAIHRMDQELTPLVGRPDWFLGLLPVGDKNIRVVDSALWIMPERYNETVKDGYRFVIRLDSSDWGMACDSVAQSFTISPDEVRWRTDRGKRPWLAGTVIDHMCALMDVAAVSRLLDTAEKTKQSPI